MSRVLDWLFDLRSLGFGHENVAVDFARPIPAWGWLLVTLGAGALAWWSYSRIAGGRTPRIVLATLRGLALLLLVFIISGPRLTRANERIERDWLVVLVDRSASMTIPDAPGAAALRPREEQLAGAIAGAWPAFAEIAREKNVLWLGFDAGAYDLSLTDDGPELGQPEGRRTSIGRALEQALQRVVARPLSGIVIVSDGRSSDEPTRQALRRLQAERIGIYTVALGSQSPIADLAVERAEAPSLAFINDTVPVSVEISRMGGGEAADGGSVQLVDKWTGLVLDEQPIPAGEGGVGGVGGWRDGRAAVTLTSSPAEPGRTSWVVRLKPAGPDLLEHNNSAEVAVELVDRPLRVLYLDGYPRWEHRYLKNLLLREKSILSASLLVAANRQYTQEGEVTLGALPRTPEEWSRFDVIVLGDLPGSMFSREQLENLREHIAVRGAGLLWIAGEGATPQAWRATPLADLLPFSLAAAPGSQSDDVGAWGLPVTMTRTGAAERLGLLSLGEDGGWPERLSDPRTGWSRLHYAQRIDPRALKPTAEVLATASPQRAGASAAGESAPLVLSMRYGAGRVLYVGTDEVWRWRYARGEALPERFWLPLIRLQGRESLARAARPAVLEAAPRSGEVGGAIRISLQLLDQALVDAAPQGRAVSLRIARADAGPGAARDAIDLSLTPEPGTVSAGARGYAATWVPDEPGQYRLTVTDPALASLSLTTEAEVLLADDEFRRPEADHLLLARLSEQTEGEALTADDLGRLAEILPRREVRIAGAPDVETLWDKPLVLAAMVLLLTLEWVGRRILKLA